MTRQRARAIKRNPKLPMSNVAEHRRFMHLTARTCGDSMLITRVARSDSFLTGCQELRFQVYCKERNFLHAADYPTQIESDEFDAFATHLAVFGTDGEIVGTARIVRASAFGFPLQRYSSPTLPHGAGVAIGEVSRLAVPRATAKRYGARTGARSRDVALRLYQAIYAQAKEQELTHLIAAMEPSLVRLCGYFDIPWEAIGAEVDHGGIVRPYLLSLAAFDSIKTTAAIRFRREGGIYLESDRACASLSRDNAISPSRAEAMNGSEFDRAREARAA